MNVNIGQRLDAIERLLRQLADQQAALMKQTRSGGQRSAPTERPNPALVKVPDCSRCVSGWVIDSDGLAVRCECSEKGSH